MILYGGLGIGNWVSLIGSDDFYQVIAIDSYDDSIELLPSGADDTDTFDVPIEHLRGIELTDDVILKHTGFTSTDEHYPEHLKFACKCFEAPGGYFFLQRRLLKKV